MEETGEDLHPIFTKDPEEWMQYVYKKVGARIAKNILSDCN